MRNTELNSTAATAQFKKLFESLAYTQDYATVFSDFLEYALLMLRWDKKADDFRELERRWTKPDDHRKFAEMLDMFSIAADNDGEGFYDVLGDLFMDLVSHGRNGQFFTPTPVCEMMAAINLGDAPQDGQTVCDPTCGSGRTLLAAAKRNRKMIFYGADIDLNCCRMTVLNMLLNTMEGEVAWMDTLRMEHWRSWHIKRVMNGTGYYLPYYSISGPGETHFIQRLKNSFEEMAAPAAEPSQPVAKQVPNEEPMIIVGKKNQLSLF